MFAIVPLFFAAATAANPPPARSKLTTEDCRFGEVFAFNQASCEFTFANAGNKPIRVSSFESSHEGDSVEPTTTTIAPHSKAYLKAVVNTGNDSANSRHIFNFLSDEKGHEKRVVIARGFSMSIIDQGRPSLDFGVVDMDKPLPSHKVELQSHDVPNFRIEKILSKPAWLDVDLAADGQSVTISMRANAPWGYRGDYVKLGTNSQVQNQVWIGVQANIHGTVVPSTNPVDLGLMRQGSSNERLVRLVSRDGKPFKVGPIILDKLHAKADIIPCTPAESGCKLLRLVVDKDQPIGTVVGNVWVPFPDDSQRLLIAVSGLYLAKETTIDKIDAAELMRLRNKAKTQSGSKSLDISSAIKNAVESAEEPIPAGNGPLLKWSVKNEAILHGYQIFRSANENGPFVLLNLKSVLVKKHDNTGSSYQYRDTTATPGKTYWYYIGIVYNDGHKQQLSGPQKVVAK